jgi:RND family efflux transporter MFP subunit
MKEQNSSGYDHEHSSNSPTRLGEEPPAPRSTTGPPARPASRRGVILALVVLGLLIALVSWQRWRDNAHLREITKRDAAMPVTVIRPISTPGGSETVLPGSLMAYSEAPIYARTNGYLRKFYVDIGSPVEEGQLMAEIEAPDVDAQLRQVSSALAQSKANLEIARLNFDRQKSLRAQNVNAAQDLDQARTTFEAAQAAVEAAQANLQNLQIQQGFQKITAPFAGIVTRRNTDIGALINSGAATSTELFHVARNNPLRAYIAVPQSASPFVKVGASAWAELQEFPGQRFQGQVAHTAGALEPSSRTMLTEVQIPNPDGRLLPGSFARVHLTLEGAPAQLSLPSNALLFRSEGPQVGTVDESGIVKLKSVKLGRDFGKTLEVIDGLTANDQVILNPSDSLANGTRVEAKPQAAAPATPPPAPKK